MELRRINALLGKLEEMAAKARLGLAFESVKQLPKLETEIERQRVRLMVILAPAKEGAA